MSATTDPHAAAAAVAADAATAASRCGGVATSAPLCRARGSADPDAAQAASCGGEAAPSFSHVDGCGGCGVGDALILSGRCGGSTFVRWARARDCGASAERPWHGGGLRGLGTGDGRRGGPRTWRGAMCSESAGTSCAE